MPLQYEIDDTESISFDELIEYLRLESIDTSNISEFEKAAPMLKKLSNNKSFLADRALEELKRGYKDPLQLYEYTAQVMILHRSDDVDENFLMRANFWPSENDQLIKAGGTEPFFYYRPHDHNFHFLTVGYYGPGYSSNYYEYDPSAIDGFPGEHVPSLKFTKKCALEQGELMLYRSSIDVHEQLPAESMSISVNILENTGRARLIDQYSFDLDRKTIKQIINITATPCVFSVAASLGGENAQDLLTNITANSPDPFYRFCAHKALANQQSELDGYRQVMSKAMTDKSSMVSKWTSEHLKILDKENDQANGDRS